MTDETFRTRLDALLVKHGDLLEILAALPDLPPDQEYHVELDYVENSQALADERFTSTLQPAELRGATHALTMAGDDAARWGEGFVRVTVENGSYCFEHIRIMPPCPAALERESYEGRPCDNGCECD